MGLTHYWRRPAILSPPAFSNAVGDCRKIMPLLSVPLANGATPAVFTDQLIHFNGAGTSRCETFAVRRIELNRRTFAIFSFTKTNGLPYDLCVRVALIILQHHLGNDFQVISDDHNWDHAREVCQTHLGYGRGFHLI